jgi:adhesin/invasin
MLFVISSCQDSGVVTPNAPSGQPSFDIIDGSTSGVGSFFFLQPIADQSPTLTADFNPFLRPSMRVCAIPVLGDPERSCDKYPYIVASFAAGTADVGSDRYTFSWDTNGPETYGDINTDEFLLLEILVGDSIMGSIELDPQDPDGPGKSDEPAYAFRLGETIPVKFWLSEETLCTGDAYVTECITGAVVDNTGANLSLQDEGNKLGVIIYEQSLPEPYTEITVTIERINPVDFFNATGEECIPGIGAMGAFDAPQFGDCFRVRTIPDLGAAELRNFALVSICLDPADLSTFGLSAEQQDQLTMVRFNDKTNDEWEQLADAFGDCPTTQASLLDVPDSGFMRYAAMGINALADFVGPEPVEARDVRLGGLTSSFSRFRYALPGQMVPTDGNGEIIQPFDDNTVAATINVIDWAGLPVADAVVHFETADGTLPGGTTSFDAVSDTDGNATVQWTVDRTAPGEKTITATALGLLDGPVTEHNQNDLFEAASVDITLTVVGPPTAINQDPAANIDDAVAGEPETVTVFVTDTNGNPVEGAPVSWTCSPQCLFPNGTDTITTFSDAAGEATVDWTPLTQGSQLSVGSIGGGVTDATFTATVAAAAAVEPTWPTAPSTGTAGLALDALSITVVDQYGNPRAGDVVSWTVNGPNGASAPVETPTDADGVAQFTWTLAQLVGENSLTIAVVGTTFSTEVTVEGLPGTAVQPTGTPTDAQNGTVAAALGTPLTVTVVDQFDNPIAGQTVTWSTAEGGSFAPESTTTDASGAASTTWTLGTGSGAQQATATIGTFTVTFDALAAPGEPATLTPAGGDVTQTVGSTAALTVTVTDLYGNVVPGAEVTWSGNGGFSSATSIADAGGVASVTWTLATAAGAQSASAAIGALSTTFAATATPGVAANVVPTGAGGSYAGGTALPLSITVTDQYGNARLGDMVTWTSTGGSVSGETTTGVGGLASATWTLGTQPGDFTASASVGGLTANFYANVRCFVNVDGTRSEGEWDCAAGNFYGFTANISGGSTPAELQWQTDGTNVYFLVRVRQSSIDKVNSLRIDFDNTGNGASGDDDIIGYSYDGKLGSNDAAAYDWYLTDRCVNRSQSSCGTADATKNVKGGFNTDGTWIVYELSHPLAGGAQDFSKSVGDQIGLFLTLSIGNGAQGNTQSPGFRQYVPITIR